MRVIPSFFAFAVAITCGGTPVVSTMQDEPGYNSWPVLKTYEGENIRRIQLPLSAGLASDRMAAADGQLQCVLRVWEAQP